ncbi:TonB-dependent receptor [Dysgonomonas sp. 25]|uniref:TonB-dependent receptor n=1 Tax=Dysgonomonas sp. 25 TaxID=2302933 RepID=UPI0013D865FA|nr:TonB-dependent receptor [Dysgonomonas sp. 25]NDV70242.1 TonB-dependent receptor [Dysgonomonas sp. 25]
MKKLLICLSASFLSVALWAHEGDGNPDPAKPDTLYTELKNDIVILSTTKETNSLKSLPASVSIFSQKNLEGLQVTSFKDLSAIVPNYFVADYGSKMTAPLYIRGIGARSGFQTVSMYVDNIPYFNTTSFDNELYDIQRVEVLRGTQATLYGRNAMGGIINIYTYSPLTYEGTTLRLGGGSHGQFSASGSHYRRLSKTTGISVGAYYNQNDGYFRNKFDGKKVDDLKDAGGRVKFVWQPNTRFSATLSTNFDYIDQGAFPYKELASDEIDYNSDGYYKRKLFTNGLALRYAGEGYEINSTTGYQYLNDEMNMDQDYTPLSVFQINQRQKESSLSQEVTIKSASDSWYQWSAGVFGFYDYLHTTPPVYMMQDGINNILNAQMTAVGAPISFTDSQIDLDGNYKRPTYGAAVFHQSTFNDLGVKGLSATLGVRLDYEKTKLKYNSYTTANFVVAPRPPISLPFTAEPVIKGEASDDYLEFLPKAVLKYQIDPNSHVYVSASRGYKAGGHNIQMFADLLQEALIVNMFDQMPPAMLPMLPPAVQNMLNALKDLPPTNERISYKPELSWSYEFGGQQSLFDNALSINYSAFYMDVKDVQLTKFVASGGGRMIANGGKAVSKGFEVGLKARPCTGFFLYGNYGFADAKFRKYVTDEGDFSHNYIPFAPRSTFSVGGNLSYDTKNCPVIDRVTLDVNYAGVGKVYWEESNTMSQGFYGTLNAQIGFEKGIFALELWGKNVLDREYNAFVFESSRNYFGQQGRPARWGASVKIKL